MRVVGNCVLLSDEKLQFCEFRRPIKTAEMYELMSENLSCIADYGERLRQP